jgi:hypothetical protein
MTRTMAGLKSRSNLPRKGMSSCNSNVSSDTTPPEDYSLTCVRCARVPKSLDSLERLLGDWAKTSNGRWTGKLYVATTICWDTKKREFLQDGCSPNYRGGLWTLTCCKHDMLAAKSFEDAVKGDCPVMIFTLSKVSRKCHRQYLVSVARVTNSFETMEDYARFLRTRGNETLSREKLSRMPRSERFLGWRFGDCHADRNHKVKAPGQSHVHAKPKAYRQDFRKHLLLASNCFVTWSCPTLWASETLGQSRYGMNVKPENLRGMLIER